MIVTFMNFVKLAIAWEFFGTVNPSTVCSIVTLGLDILYTVHPTDEEVAGQWQLCCDEGTLCKLLHPGRPASGEFTFMLVSMLPPVRNCLWSNAGKPLYFLDDGLAVGQVTTCIQAYLTVDCLAVWQVVIEAWSLLPSHSLNLLPHRLLHLQVPGQVEDTPDPIGYAGC